LPAHLGRRIISAGESNEPSHFDDAVHAHRALIALLGSAMLLPFLPGRHDPLAVNLSAAATGVAFAGLLLVPIGVA
jgi:hypothetical protein